MKGIFPSITWFPMSWLGARNPEEMKWGRWWQYCEVLPILRSDSQSPVCQKRGPHLWFPHSCGWAQLSSATIRCFLYLTSSCAPRLKVKLVRAFFGTKDGGVRTEYLWERNPWVPRDWNYVFLFISPWPFPFLVESRVWLKVRQWKWKVPILQIQVEKMNFLWSQ